MDLRSEDIASANSKTIPFALGRMKLNVRLISHVAAIRFSDIWSLGI